MAVNIYPAPLKIFIVAAEFKIFKFLVVKRLNNPYAPQGCLQDRRSGLRFFLGFPGKLS
jgi:hypothetical protein